MWPQYARGVTTVLADLIHEAEEVDCQQLSLSLETIAAMTRLGVQQLGEARAMAHWRKTGNPRRDITARHLWAFRPRSRLFQVRPRQRLVHLT
jgi:hypothetical protein